MRFYNLCRNNNNILVTFFFCLLFIFFISCTTAPAPIEGFAEQGVESQKINENKNGLKISYINQEGKSQIEFLENKPTLIIFWADYCFTCKKELPKINARIDELEKKFDVLALAHGEIEITNKFVEENFIDRLTVGFSTQEIRDTYGIIGQPITIIIGTDGEVLYKHFGSLLFDEILNF